MKDRYPFSRLATDNIGSSGEMRIGGGVATHNYGRRREYKAAVMSRTGTYRLAVTKHDHVDPDEVQHGSIPILRHCQAGHSLRRFGGIARQ